MSVTKYIVNNVSGQTIGGQVINPYPFYTEIPISYDTLINPPQTPNGANGVILLPELPSGQYYEWKMNLEFYPSGIYTIPPGSYFSLYGTYIQYPNLSLSDITQNTNLIWQVDSRTGMQSSYSISAESAGPLSSDLCYLGLFWAQGVFQGGTGTMKAKIWYNIINLG